MDLIKAQIKFPEGHKYNDGLTLFQNIVLYAEVENNFQLMEKLVKEFKVDVNEKIKKDLYTALNYQLLLHNRNHSDMKTLKFLLDNGANVNYIDHKGMNVIQHYHNAERIKLLYDYGANIYTHNSNGKGFIHCLVDSKETNNHVEILEFLVGKNVDFNVKTKDGRSAYDIIDKNKNPIMYKLLMKNKKKNIKTGKKGIKKSKKSKKGTNKNNRVFHRTTNFYL